jgi:putative oxidoreductase
MTVFENSNATSTIGNARFSDFVILTARVMIGLIFVLSGWPKLLHYHATVAALGQRGIPEFLAYLGPPVEFFGGVAILIGFVTPYAGALLFAFTLIATATSHRFWEFSDPAQYRVQNTNFWKNVSMMGGMLLLLVTAGGRYSIDHLLFRRRLVADRGTSVDTPPPT